MLQSIGMTGRQLKRMLSFEGLYYAMGTIITSVVLGGLFSVVVVRGISSGIWFFTYRFVMWPMLVIYQFCSLSRLDAILFLCVMTVCNTKTEVIVTMSAASI